MDYYTGEKKKKKEMGFSPGLKGHKSQAAVLLLKHTVLQHMPWGTISIKQYIKIDK